MVDQGFRLVRMLEVGSTPGFDYLAYLDPEAGPVYTEDQSAAHIFSTWENFVEAARSIWLRSGPLDIFHETVYLMIREAANA